MGEQFITHLKIGDSHAPAGGSMLYASQLLPLKIHAWSTTMSGFWTVGQDH